MMRDRQLLPNEKSAMDGVTMYETNFGFHRQPFQSADLARAFFVSASIRGVLPQILHAMRSDLGIAVLTGPPGAGKTSLLKYIQSLLSTEGRAVLCSGAGLESPADVLQTLCAASMLRAGEAACDSSTVPSSSSRWTVLDQMRRTTEFWGPVLLLIDDAQLLPVAVLNELRAFTEEEVNGRSPVRCLIAGPLSMEEMLARPEHADFSRRIRCHAFLQPLSTRESIEFLSRHIEIVGGRLSSVFSPGGLELIAAASDGLPRCLSLLADESLIVASERTLRVVDEDCVRTALMRMQHLPYAWNASPLQDAADHGFSQNVSTPEDQTKLSESPRQGKTLPGFIEIGAPGIIEVGGNVSHAHSEPASRASDLSVAGVSGEARIDSHSTATDATLTHQILPAMDSPAVEEEFPADPEIQPVRGDFADRVPATFAAFEVGHRYLPDAMESLEAVEMDSFDSAESTCGETLSVTAAEPYNLLDTVAVPDRVDAVQESDRTPIPVSDLRESRTSFTELSSRLPVFDRYTWIALGREVPSGNYSVTSASEMIRAGFAEGECDADAMELSASAAAVFDQIPVRLTSDAAILASLSEFGATDEQGTFLPIRAVSVDVAEAMVLDSSSRRSEKLIPSVATVEETAAGPGFVGLEHFNAADVFAAFSAASPDGRISAPGVGGSETENHAVVSESNRRVIENAIRSALSSVSGTGRLSVEPLAEDFDTDKAVGFAGRNLSSEAEEGHFASGESSEPSWNDGQLLFSGGHKEPDSALQRNASLSEAGAETEQISLSFEAARQARGAAFVPSRDLAGGDPAPDRFFTLPEDVRTIEWDLRAGLLSTDDVSPLAESLASLRNEVTAFQHFSREEDSGTHISVSEAERGDHFPTSGGALPDSVLSVAKRRLESEEIPDQACETSTVVQSLVTDCVSEFDLSEVAGGSRSVEVESSTEQPRFSKLFTQLRALRSSHSENR